MSADDILVFAGSGSPKLTRAICAYLNIEPALGEVLRFSEGNLFVRVKENVRGRRTYVVQSTVYPTNDNFMELLFWIDALKRASAESVTVIMPYFSLGWGPSLYPGNLKIPLAFSAMTARSSSGVMSAAA